MQAMEDQMARYIGIIFIGLFFLGLFVYIIEGVAQLGRITLGAG